MSHRQKQHGGLLDGINKPQVAVYCRSHILTSADQKATPLVGSHNVIHYTSHILLPIIAHVTTQRKCLSHLCPQDCDLQLIESAPPPPPHGWLSLSHCNPLRLITVPATRSAMLTDPIVLQCIIALYCSAQLQCRVWMGLTSALYSLYIYNLYYTISLQCKIAVQSADGGWVLPQH